MTVWVFPKVRDGGHEFKARLLTLGPRTVTLLVDGQRREMDLSSVTHIERRGDSLKNGAIIGAAFVGGVCAVICGQGLDDGGELAAAVVINAAFGALIGTGIDALHKGRTVIYPTPAPKGQPKSPRPFVTFRLRF